MLGKECKCDPELEGFRCRKSGVTGKVLGMQRFRLGRMIDEMVLMPA